MNEYSTVEECYQYINECGSNLELLSQENNIVPIDIVMIECRKLIEFVNTMFDIKRRRCILEIIEYNRTSLCNRDKCVLDAAYQRIRFVLSFCNNTEAQKIWVSLIILCGRVLRYVPEEVMTTSMCDLSLSQNIRFMIHIPIRLLTHTFCARWIKKHPYLINILPREVLTHSLYEVAVKSYPFIIKDLPRSILTSTLCELAICGSPSVRLIRFIPLRFMTPRLVIKAIKKNPIIFQVLPLSCKTTKVCLEILKIDGSYIRYIDTNDITYEYCLIAANNKGYKYIPSQFESTELYIIALQTNQRTIQIPRNI